MYSHIIWWITIIKPSQLWRVFLHFTHRCTVCTTGNLTSVPIVKLNSMKQLSGSQPALLVCSAYNFYPKQIKVTWLRNGREVTLGVSTSDLLPDENWYYQVHSYLEYQPTSAEQISCMVKHLTLSKPVLQVWGKWTQHHTFDILYNRIIHLYCL